MTNMNNPLRQYFRRPALYIKLPSKGKYYPANTLELPDSGEIPVYPMTAIDEITSRTPDALFNGTAIAELIKSCVPAIKDPWSMPSTDLDAVMIGIRAATTGNELEVESTCESCNETSKYGINIIGLLTDINPASYEKTLELGDLIIKFRPLTYKDMNKGNMDQFEVQRVINQLNNIEDENARANASQDTIQKLTDMNIGLVSKTIESISTPSEIVEDKEFIREYLRSCDKTTFELIRDRVVELRESTNIKPLKIKCVNCGHEYQQTLTINVTDFFG